ncbi:MAG: hypothetical protein AABY18_06245 [Candidatus Thermoplasmatota archaeon]
MRNETLQANVTIDATGRTTLDVPLDVFLVGFPADLQPRVQDLLPALPVVPHYDDPVVGHGAILPLSPTVVFRVHALSPEFANRFEETLRMSSRDAAFLDANHAEAKLAAMLLDEGFAVSQRLPGLVYLSLATASFGDHAWLYEGELPAAENPYGYYSNVRVFGGKEPLLVVDTSARADPDPTYGSQGRAYEGPIASEDAQLADLLAEQSRSAATNLLYRHLYWPPSTAACNAITILYGIRTAAVQDGMPLDSDPRAAIHTDRLMTAFEHLTGRPVFVDLKVLMLPQDDAALDAVTRAWSSENYADTLTGLAGGAGVQQVPPVPWEVDNALLEVVGQWVDTNWNTAWVPHEGCEGYLAILIWGDGGDAPLTFGNGVYPTEATHRWMVASFGFAERYLPSVNPYAGNGLGLVDGVTSHEVGHIFGLHHPHSQYDGQEAWTFSKAIDVMSYPWTGATVEHGVFNAAAYARGRAGLAIQEAAAEGRLAPATDGIVAALAQWDWEAAAQAASALKEPT